MKIVVPMSGTGERYLAAGYTAPKPLIPVDGRPMIEGVLSTFPRDAEYVFICNADHLKTTPLKSVLTALRPRSRIVAIEPHKKGPVFAVTKAFDTFSDNEEVIINYCDFGVDWSFEDGLRTIRAKAADGAMTAYRGFHPHSLGTTNYAYIQHQDNWLTKIQEKKPFTNNRMEEYASSGLYYFARGSFVKSFFPMLMEKGISTGGEYYVSEVYNLMREAGLRTYIYELDHFLQWGTPDDIEDYQYWSDHFRQPSRRPSSLPPSTTYNLVLMAGRGERFLREGFSLPKPLIPVDGEPMVINAMRSLPPGRRCGIVMQRSMAEQYPIQQTIERAFGSCDLLSLEAVTEGQAATALAARRMVGEDGALLISACDNGMVYDPKAYNDLISDPGTDAVIWTFRRHVSLARNPNAFGWVKVEGREARQISVKKPISDHPKADHAIVGTFWFRRAGDFFEAAEAMIAADDRVNGEFYIDQAMNWLIKNGKRVRVFEIDVYLGWGTPNDLKTYQYWGGYFSGAKG